MAVIWADLPEEVHKRLCPDLQDPRRPYAEVQFFAKAHMAKEDMAVVRARSTAWDIVWAGWREEELKKREAPWPEKNPWRSCHTRNYWVWFRLEPTKEVNVSDAIEFDFDEYYKLEEPVRSERWPHTKVRFSGESLWARKLGPTLRMLDNQPLEKGYHWADIVKVDGNGNIVELVKHTFPRRYGFRYESAGDETARLAVRKGISERWARFGHDVHGSFFWEGLGFILVRGKVSTEDIVEAMTAGESPVRDMARLDGEEEERVYLHPSVKVEE